MNSISIHLKKIEIPSKQIKNQIFQDISQEYVFFLSSTDHVFKAAKKSKWAKQNVILWNSIIQNVFTLVKPYKYAIFVYDDIIPKG